MKSKAFDHSKYPNWIDPETVLPYERNAKQHTEKQIKNLVNSINRFGWQQDVVITSDNVLVIGHGRRLAALQIGCDMPYHVIDKTADALTDADIRELRIADNQTNAETGMDFSALEAEIEDLSFDGFDFDFGFDFDDEEEPAEIVEDEVPEEVETRCKLGDVWRIGNHRLICGDSTDPAVIDRLMDGVKADMLFTSPPYSDMREYNGGKDLSVSNISKFIGVYKPYTDYQCVNLGIQRKNHEIVQYWDEYIAKAKECGYKLLAWNVWDKMACGSIGQQSAFFPIRHEWIFVFGTEFYEINLTQQKKSQPTRAKESTTRRQADGSLRKSSKGDQSHSLKQMESVLQLTPVKVHDIDHPAPFPVELPAEYIKAMTDEGNSVIEPFGGSGSTLIACEQLNRKCYICELDPHYCDVIIQRWENLTGKKAVLLNV